MQAICRTNRPYGEQKTHGLIVDYLGIFDDVAQALKFDEEGVKKAVSNIAELINAARRSQADNSAGTSATTPLRTTGNGIASR